MAKKVEAPEEVEPASIKVPADLARRAEALAKVSRLGYRNRSELIVDLVRRGIQEMEAALLPEQREELARAVLDSIHARARGEPSSVSGSDAKRYR